MKRMRRQETAAGWGARLVFLLAISVNVCVPGRVDAAAAVKSGAKEATREDEVDPVALASVLIQDKHFERARAVLQAVNPLAASSEVDLGKYYMLLGLTELELGDHKAAATALEKSVQSGEKEKVVFVFMAQAKYRLEDYKGAIAAIEKAGDAAEELPGMYLLHAQCHWREGDRPSAYRVLEEGLRAFPDDDALMKNRVLLLVDMGLYQAAMSLGTKYLSDKKAKPDAYVALAEALISGKQYEEAIVLLETARLRYPGDPNVVIQLAKAYMQDEHLFVAARLFEHASRISPDLTLDAAELYRRAGRLTSAVRLNAGIVDQKSKIRQRLGLLIELQRFEEAASLKPRLERLGLLEEDAVTYGLAYAFFMTGRFDEAETELKKLSDGQLFEKAIQLRRIMGRCTGSGQQCPYP